MSTNPKPTSGNPLESQALQFVEAAPAQTADVSAPYMKAIRKQLRSGPAFILLVLVALILLFGALSAGHRFLEPSNLLTVGADSTSLILLSVGLTFVLATGELDLSIAPNLILSSVVAGKVILALAGTATQTAAGIYPHEAVALLAGVAAGVASGGLVGLINGILVTRLKMNSFIVTLGVMGGLTGLYNILTNGSNIANLPTSLQSDFGYATYVGIPAPFLLGLVVAALAWISLSRTVFGRHVLAKGSSSAAARRAGVNVARVTVRAFVICGMCAGIAGVIDLTKFGTTALAGHDTDLMQALSAVIIGGTSLFGGIASVAGTVIASLILTVLLSGLVIINVPPFYQYIAVGAILVVAVYVDALRRGRL